MLINISGSSPKEERWIPANTIKKLFIDHQKDNLNEDVDCYGVVGELEDGEELCLSEYFLDVSDAVFRMKSIAKEINASLSGKKQ